MIPLKERLVAFHKVRKQQCKANFFVLDESKEIDACIQIIADLEVYPLKEMSSWILTHYVKKHPEKIQPYYPILVDVIFKTKDQTVLRNCTNILYHLIPTEYKEGELIELLIHFIRDNTNKVALQVYSIYLLTYFVKKYPELKQEVKSVISLNSSDKSPAFQVALRNFNKMV